MHVSLSFAIAGTPCVIRPPDAFSTRPPLASQRFGRNCCCLHVTNQRHHRTANDVRTHTCFHASPSAESAKRTPLSAVSSTFTFPGCLLFLLAWCGTPQLPPLDSCMHVYADDTSPQMLSTRSDHISTNTARETFMKNLKPRQALAVDSNTRSAQQPHRKQYTLESLYLNREGRLMDLSAILDEAYTTAILEEINAVSKETGTELQVVIADRVSYNILAKGSGSEREYAKDLFRGWHNGRADKQSGVLVLVLLQQQRVEIAVSKDLNPYLASQSYATTSYWCTDMPKRGAVSMFQSDCYGEWTYNVVVGVANQIRAINGAVASKGPASTDDILDALAKTLLVGLPGVIVWTIGCGIMHDRMYPMGEGYHCSQCGGKKWNKVGSAWVQEPTYDTDGLEKIICKCSSCGFEDSTARKVSKLSGSDFSDKIY